MKKKAISRPQDAAQERLEHAQRMMREKVTQLRRVTTALAAWTRKAGYYAQRASMTDEQVAAEKQARLEKERTRAAKRVRRGIALPGAVGGKA